jgi:NAD(P)-dependent dehydrogenase (short-subunit alcohol dehydrogenase family)
MTKKRWTTTDIDDQTGRVAIVTGANSGIGFEAAKALADKGAQVIVAARSPKRGEKAVAEIRNAVPSAIVKLMLLDLANLDSVNEFAVEFAKRFDRLDLLVNNAGVMMPKVREETADGFELQFGINHLGHFALTLKLLPLLVATKDSRIVNVSSSAQNFGKLDLDDLQWTKRSFHRMGSYGASKIANMLFNLELKRCLEDVGASTIVAACHPGWTSTNLQKTSPLFRFLNPILGMKPWQGALPTLYAAVATDVESGGYYGPDGLGTMRGYPVPNKPADISTDAAAAKQLWALSEKMTGVETPSLSPA